MNNVTVLCFSPQFNNFVSFPYVYALFKHYYEVNGKETYNWIDPKYLKQNIDPKIIAEWLASLDLKYLFASLYIWNYNYTHSVLREYRKLCPDTIIVAGGPNVFIRDPIYFLEHPWVNVCCDPNVYGEVFITDLLDGNDWEEVTGAVWKTGRSFKPFVIRDFEWAPSPYENNLDYAISLVYEYTNVSMQLETSRGCPFKCSFCEWGGGIGTKMNKRKLEDIKKDIDAMVVAGVYAFQICDSNFGFWEEDVEVMRYIADYKKTLNIPKTIEIYGWSKNNHKYHYDILKHMTGAGFTQHYAISLQSIKEETLKNINRFDVPIQQRIEFARKVQKEIGTPIQFEILLGLPGDTIDEYYDAIDLRHEFKDFINFVWWMLPNTEGHTPEYRKKHGILTAWTQTVEAEFEDWESSVWEETQENWEYVIGTSTLTPQEWLEGYILDRFYVAAKQKDKVWDKLEAVRAELNLSPSMFWRRLMKAIPVVEQGDWHEMWEEAWPQFNSYIIPGGLSENFYVVTVRGKRYKFPAFAFEFYRRAIDEAMEFVKNYQEIGSLSNQQT